MAQQENSVTQEEKEVEQLLLAEHETLIDIFNIVGTIIKKNQDFENIRDQEKRLEELEKELPKPSLNFGKKVIKFVSNLKYLVVSKNDQLDKAMEIGSQTLKKMDRALIKISINSDHLKKFLVEETDKLYNRFNNINPERTSPIYSHKDFFSKMEQYEEELKKRKQELKNVHGNIQDLISQNKTIQGINEIRQEFLELDVKIPKTFFEKLKNIVSKISNIFEITPEEKFIQGKNKANKLLENIKNDLVKVEQNLEKEVKNKQDEIDKSMQKLNQQKLAQPNKDKAESLQQGQATGNTVPAATQSKEEGFLPSNTPQNSVVTGAAIRIPPPLPVRSDSLPDASEKNPAVQKGNLEKSVTLQDPAVTETLASFPPSPPVRSDSLPNPAVQKDNLEKSVTEKSTTAQAPEKNIPIPPAPPPPAAAPPAPPPSHPPGAAQGDKDVNLATALQNRKPLKSVDQNAPTQPTLLEQIQQGTVLKNKEEADQREEKKREAEKQAESLIKNEADKPPVDIMDAVMNFVNKRALPEDDSDFEDDSDWEHQDTARKNNTTPDSKLNILSSVASNNKDDLGYSSDNDNTSQKNTVGNSIKEQAKKAVKGVNSSVVLDNKSSPTPPSSSPASTKKPTQGHGV